jgi:hypothetical protein
MWIKTAGLVSIVALGFGFALAVADENIPIVPNDHLTPGVIASRNEAEVCGYVNGLSYSKRHRVATREMKDEVFRLYGISRAGRSFEVDDRIPISLGGANVVQNLWPEAGFTHPSYHDKDRLEFYVWEAVCKYHRMTLAEGQDIFLNDWTVGYRQIFGHAP